MSETSVMDPSTTNSSPSYKRSYDHVDVSNFSGTTMDTGSDLEHRAIRGAPTRSLYTPIAVSDVRSEPKASSSRTSEIAPGGPGITSGAPLGGVSSYSESQSRRTSNNNNFSETPSQFNQNPPYRQGYASSNVGTSYGPTPPSPSSLERLLNGTRQGFHIPEGDFPPYPPYPTGNTGIVNGNEQWQFRSTNSNTYGAGGSMSSAGNVPNEQYPLAGDQAIYGDAGMTWPNATDNGLGLLPANMAALGDMWGMPNNFE